MLDEQRDDDLHGQPGRRHRSGSSAVESSSHGTNGSQIRSTSALLIRDSVGEHDRRRRGRDEAAAPPRSRARPSATTCAEPGAEHRAGAHDQRGQVGPDPVRRGAVRAMPAQ